MCPLDLKSSMPLERYHGQTFKVKKIRHEIMGVEGGGKENGHYHNSPSKKMSAGMSSITSWGIRNAFPCLEKNVFKKGFQNARTPSYFSNTHLENNNIIMREKREERREKREERREKREEMNTIWMD